MLDRGSPEGVESDEYSRTGFIQHGKTETPPKSYGVMPINYIPMNNIYLPSIKTNALITNN